MHVNVYSTVGDGIRGFSAATWVKTLWSTLLGQPDMSKNIYVASCTSCTKAIQSLLNQMFSWRHPYMEMFSALLALCAGNTPVARWIPLTKASDAELWCFLWFVPEQRIKHGTFENVIPFITWMHGFWCKTVLVASDCGMCKTTTPIMQLHVSQWGAHASCRLGAIADMVNCDFA